ncbi:MAG: type 1 glutamine amidotransferase domain-containing protein [Conexivisphaerales archaeon]
MSKGSYEVRDRVLILASDDVEDVELLYPYYRLKEEGYLPVVASAQEGSITGKHGYRIEVDLLYSQVKPEQYTALLLPGGRSPERVRLDQHAISIVKHFIERKKPIAAICHGPQILISANAVKGRRMTCWKGVRDDLIAAGAKYEDKEVVQDGEFITSRQPSDLPYFMSSFLRMLKSEAKSLAAEAKQR